MPLDAEKVKAYQREYRRKNLEKTKRYVRTWRAKKLGIVGMPAEVSESCDLCGQPPNEKQLLHCDHDHDTGKFRGWLCRSCNVGLGHFRDEPELLLKAIKYLMEKK